MGSTASLALLRVMSSARVPDVIQSSVWSWEWISESLGSVWVHEKSLRLRSSIALSIPHRHLSLPVCVWLSTGCYGNTPWDVSVWRHSKIGLSCPTQPASEYTSGSYLCHLTPKLSPPAHPPPFLSLCVSICHWLWLPFPLPWCQELFLLLLWRPSSNILLFWCRPLLSEPPPLKVLLADMPDFPGSYHPFTCHPDPVTPTPREKVQMCPKCKKKNPRSLRKGDWQGAGPLRMQGRCRVAKQREMIDSRVKLKLRRVSFHTPLADSSLCGTREKGIAL